MRLSASCAALVAACTLAASAAHAQRGASLPIELGIDGGVTFGLGDADYTRIALPGQRFRVGFFTSDAISIEPAIALNYVSTGDTHSTDFVGDVGVLFHTSPTAGGSRVYLRPFAGLETISFSSDNPNVDDSTTQFHLGAGVGIKVPLANRLRARFEANFLHGFDSSGAGDTSGNAIGLTAGLSFFTR